MADNKSVDILPAAWLSQVYPDASRLFAVAVKPLEEVKDKCVVVLDTNVLLTPYTVGAKSLREIQATYSRLVKEKRLRIPAQVAREFVKNRAQKMEELFQQLSRKAAALPRVNSGTYPLLEPIEAYSTVLEVEKELEKQHEQYREALGKLIAHVKAWTWNDPVSALYAQVFKPGVVIDHKLDSNALSVELKRRVDNRIPSGYKDAGKPDGGVGDMAIWLAILETGRSEKRDILFVSGDEKADWWHRSEGQSLYPRFELVEEFHRESHGASFHIVKFSAMLDLFGAEPKVVAEIREEEREASAPPLRVAPAGGNYYVVRRHLQQTVAKWARRRFQAESLILDPPDGPDILLVDGDGDNVGIEVLKARAANPSLVTHRIRESAYRGHWLREQFALTILAIVVVAEDRASALRLIAHLHHKQLAVPEVHIHVGVLDTTRRFVELEEIRLG